MDSAAKRRVAEYYGKEGPESLPAHIIEFFDRAEPVFRIIETYNVIPRKDWAILSLVADELHKLEERLVALEASASGAAKPSVPPKKKE